MKNYLRYSLMTWIIISFSFLPTEKAFSQTDASGTTPKENSATVKGITPGRARALVGVAFSLVSLVVGWRAQKRSAAGIGNKGRNGAIVALSLGVIAIVLSIIHLSVSVGAVFGSGSGKAGAIFALILSLVGITLSWLRFVPIKRSEFTQNLFKTPFDSQLACLEPCYLSEWKSWH